MVPCVVHVPPPRTALDHKVLAKKYLDQLSAPALRALLQAFV